MIENTAENLEVEQEENVVPDIEVQVVDDTPQEDQGRPARTCLLYTSPSPRDIR